MQKTGLRNLIETLARRYASSDSVARMDDIDAVRFIQSNEGYSTCFGSERPLIPLQNPDEPSEAEQGYCGMLDCLWLHYCNDLRGCAPKSTFARLPNEYSKNLASIATLSNWNTWRQRNPGLEIDPHLEHRISDICRDTREGVSIEGKNLQKINLSGLSLNGSSFAGSDLSEASLICTNLSTANLSRSVFQGAQNRYADFSNADLSFANLLCADFRGANLSKANLRGANLTRANFADSDLAGADLGSAHLEGTILRGANLRGATLICARLLWADLTNTDLRDCHVYGISAWDIVLDGAAQSDLIVTPPGDPVITVDDLEVAQFVYLLLNNRRVRNIIDAITSKVVLILGRFTPERKAILDAIRNELRQRNYLPVLFDFEKPSRRTTLEAVATLAHMAKFVIADLTDARSVLQELMAVVPNNPSVPVQPLLLASTDEPGMFDFFKKYPWVIECVRYEQQEDLLRELQQKVIGPAERIAAVPPR